jgi:hypothetical protein
VYLVAELENFLTLREVLGVDVGVVGWEGVDWIHLALDRDQWRAVVNTVMNLRVP